mgnify:FL=1
MIQIQVNGIGFVIRLNLNDIMTKRVLILIRKVMKAIKIFSCLILASLFTNVNAQLRVLSDGRVQAGTFMPNQDYDNIKTFQVLGKYGDMHAGAKMPFGDFGRYQNQSLNVFLGEYGTTDSDQLWLHGKLGVFLTATGYANKVIAYYNPASNSNFVFNTNLVVNGVNITSDVRLKDNIQSIEDPLGTLSQIDGVSYTYRLSEIQEAREPEEAVFSGTSNSEISISGATSSTDNTAVTAKDVEYQRLQQEIDQREAAEANRRRIGFLAQDIQKVLPELVQTNEKGIMSIDYTGFIPLIVESLKQMQQTIQDQQKEIETLQSFLPAETKSMFRSTSNEEVSVVEGAKLFNRAGASVSYTLPSTYNTADLKIFDISGKLLKKVVLTGNNSIVEINPSEIGLGTFVYTLFVDNKKADILKKFIN